MEMDTALKRQFALPVMVEHLLRAVAPELAGWLDFAVMDQLSANWTRPVAGRAHRARAATGAKRRKGDGQREGGDSAGAQRYGDAVWRIGYAGDNVRSLVLLLEFQSKPDARMGSRMLDYTGLVLDQLRRQQRLDPDGGLRVLPVVVYSGKARWSPVGAVDAVPVSAGGEPALARPHEYRLLDLRRMPVDDSNHRNPALAVLGIAAASSLAQAARWVDEMKVWLPEAIADREVRQEFGASAAQWLSVMLSRLFPEADAEEIERIGRKLFEKGGKMLSLAEKVKEWEKREQRLGFVRGKAEGIAEGEAKGEAKGKAEERALLCKQARLKFGAAVSEELARRLEPVSDAGALEAVGGLIIECADGAELLARVRPNGAG